LMHRLVRSSVDPQSGELRRSPALVDRTENRDGYAHLLEVSDDIQDH
jgi:hypothetical protein